MDHCLTTKKSQGCKKPTHHVSKFQEDLIPFYSTSLKPQVEYSLTWTEHNRHEVMENNPKKIIKNNWCTENSTCEVKELHSKKKQAMIVKKKHNKTHCKKKNNYLLCPRQM